MNKNITTALFVAMTVICVFIAMTVICVILGIDHKCTVNRLRNLQQYTDSLSADLLETQQRLWTLEEWTNCQQQDIDTICTHINLPLYENVAMANQNCAD